MKLYIRGWLEVLDVLLYHHALLESPIVGLALVLLVEAAVELQVLGLTVHPDCISALLLIDLPVPLAVDPQHLHEHGHASDFGLDLLADAAGLVQDSEFTDHDLEQVAVLEAENSLSVEGWKQLVLELLEVVLEAFLSLLLHSEVLPGVEGLIEVLVDRLLLRLDLAQSHLSSATIVGDILALEEDALRVRDDLLQTLGDLVPLELLEGVEGVELVVVDLLLLCVVLLHDGAHVLAHGRVALHSLLELALEVLDVCSHLLDVGDLKLTLIVDQRGKSAWHRSVVELNTFRLSFLLFGVVAWLGEDAVVI